MKSQLRFWLTSAQVWTPPDSSVKGVSTPGIKLILIAIITNRRERKTKTTKNLPTTGDTTDIWTCINGSGYAIYTKRPRGKYNISKETTRPHRGLKGQQEPRSSCYDGTQQADSLSPSPLSSKRIISHVFKREHEAQMSLHRTSPCHRITFFPRQTCLMQLLPWNSPFQHRTGKIQESLSGYN